MPDSLTHLKAAARKSAHEALAGLTMEQRGSAAQAIRRRLISMSIWNEARFVLLFAPGTDEPDIGPLAELGIQAGKLIALPRFNRDSGSYEAALVADPVADVTTGRFGIREPKSVCKVADLNRLDLVLVPGLAFDRHGYRLGRGKGYYDRLLAAVPGRTCGVAFDAQLISAIPVEPHDVRLNCILTPTRWHLVTGQPRS